MAIRAEVSRIISAGLSRHREALLNVISAIMIAKEVFSKA